MLPSDVKVMPNGVVIVALLPNPKGQDAGNEQVTIANSTSSPFELRCVCAAVFDKVPGGNQQHPE